MANLTGTIIAAEVTPATDQETFAVAFAHFLRGGYHAYATLAQRDAVTPERRLLYAPVYVHETKKTYRLIGGLTNTHWVADVTPGGSAVREFDVTADGSSKEFTVTHDLDGRNLQVSFADVTLPQHRIVFVHWEYVSDSAIRLMPDLVWPAGKIIRTFIR